MKILEPCQDGKGTDNINKGKRKGNHKSEMECLLANKGDQRKPMDLYLYFRKR